MSFSGEVKQEIVAHRLQRSCCRHAAAYGIACFARNFDEKGLLLYTEQLCIAKYAQWVFGQIGVEGHIHQKGSASSPAYEFEISNPEEMQKLKNLFGLEEGICFRINSKNICCSRCTGAFLGAAFLCSGTMSDPNKDYHLEFTSSRQMLAKDLEGILAEHEFSPKRTLRKGTAVIYIKASEKIEDLLTLMGATSSSLELMNVKVYRDIRNKANRITNCETANIDKTVAANLKSIQAIRYLQQSGVWELQSDSLRYAGDLRLQWPDLSLSQLAEKFQPPISKSGLNHRLRKLESIAATLQERSSHEQQDS